MNFDIDSFECQSSPQSEDQTSLYDQMSKTKQLPIKFFTQLNKHQKMLSRRTFNKQTELLRRQQSKKRHKNKSPTFKDMIMASKKFIDNEDESIQKNKNKHDHDNGSPSKKKVRFNSQRDSLDSKNHRKPSIQKNTPASAFSFYESIKQMAFELTQSKKNTSDDHKNSSQTNEKTNQSLFTGYTQKEFQDGTKFKGICENGVIIKGELHFANQFIYQGELFLDKFHGKGKLILPKKQVIEADWIQGEIVGKATIKYPRGQIYYGDLKNFRRHGKGHLFFNDGSKYQGQFNEGQLTGYGVHITTSGEKTSGYWFYGDFVGTNEQVFQNIMTNVAAHQKKKTEKMSKNIFLAKRKSQNKDKSLFQELFLNLQNLDQGHS